MKAYNPQRTRLTLAAASLASLALVSLPTSRAATLYWDGTDTGSDADGGDGTWIDDSGTTTNWDDAATGGAATAWTNANNDTAIFGGAVGTVTIGTGGVTAGGLTFDTNNYVIGGDTLTLGAAGEIANGGQATIDSVFAGSASLNKTGGGTLQLTNLANTFSGDISVGGGKVLFKSTSNDSATRTLQGGNFTGNIDIAAGARFEFWSYGGSGTPQEFSGDISGDGDVWLAYNCTFILSGTNTSTGTTTVQGELNGRTATLQIASFDSVSPSVVLGRGGMQANAILNYTGTGETTDTAIKLYSSGNSTKIVNNKGTGALTFTTPWTSVTGTGLRADVTTDADLVLQGFSIPGQPNYLVKRGSARLSLSGDCEVWNYVQLYGGTLEIDSAIGDGGVYQGAIATGPDNGGANFITVPAGTPVEVGMTVSHGRLQPGTTIAAITDINADPVVCEISTSAQGPNKTETGVIGFTGALGIFLPDVSKLRWRGDATIKYTGPSDTSNRGCTIDNGKTATWEITNSASNLEFSGGTAATSGKLTKTGAGTLTLSGTQAYTGATTVSAGTLGLVGGSQASPITVAAGASVGFTLGSPTTSTSSLDLTDGTVKITGAVDNASDYQLATASTITGTPTLDSAITDYQLELRNGNTELWLAYTGVAGSAFETWVGGTGAGLGFDEDKNGDGVDNGMAFLLGAADPDVNALGLLPTPTDDGSGGLVMTYSMLNAAKRGGAVLSVQHSSDLGIGDAWASAAVPEAPFSGPSGGVNFEVTANGDLNDVVATIPSSEAAAGKLFGRLEGSE